MHGLGHSCAAMTLKEKKNTLTLWPYFNPLKSIIIMVVFSDMDEPDSLFLLTGVSGEVSFF